MVHIPKSHPRYQSLIMREKVIEGFKKGIVTYAGLIAHGRGEAFDYLIGERTEKFAIEATKAAIAAIKLSKNPVFSVNGNVAALAIDDVIRVAKKFGMKVEVNLFYRTEERVEKIVEEFRKRNFEVLGKNPDSRIPNLDHARALCTREGIYSADLVLVPLEDGDRTQALRNMGKTVVTIDLNPLSRSARTANITIVDELTRVLKNMMNYYDEIDENLAHKILAEYDNEVILSDALRHISERLVALANLSKKGKS